GRTDRQPGEDAPRGPPRRGDRHLPLLLRAARGRRHRHRGRRRDRAAVRRHRRRRAARLRRRGVPRPRRGHPPQRRPRDQHGHDPGQVAAPGQGGAHLPRRDRAPDPRPAQDLGRAAAAGADELVLHARRLAGGARPPSRARLRRAGRLRPAQGAQDPRRRSAPGRVAGRSRQGVGAARPRRHLHRPADVGNARHADRARLLLRLHRELGQPRRGARAEDPRLVRLLRHPVRLRGDRPHPRRPQGRPRGAPPGRRAGPARDRADAARGHGRLHRRRASSLLQLQQPVDRPARPARRAAPPRGRPRPADDRQRQDGRPGRRRVAAGLPARDGDGRRGRGLRRRRGAARAAASLHTGEDDVGPPGRALRRLRPHRGSDDRAGAAASRLRAAGHARLALQAAARLRGAHPGTALAGRVRAADGARRRGLRARRRGARHGRGRPGGRRPAPHRGRRRPRIL
ncbi:MAG: UTP--glucose-1-phosphate uridylyltransferase, partial [uncultured Solirubrobacteraceae bacterium]